MIRACAKHAPPVRRRRRRAEVCRFRSVTVDGTISDAAAGETQAVEAGFVAGDRVAGRYAIERFLARGGMGAVFLARDLDSASAWPQDDPAGDRAGSRACARFKQEVLLARSVSHPMSAASSISGVTASGTAMSPSSRWNSCPVRRSPLDCARKAGCIRDGASAGASACRCPRCRPSCRHRPRDLKTDNIMLVPAPTPSPMQTPAPTGERAVITDFGLAMASKETTWANDDGETGRDRRHPAYMAPEQLRANGSGRRPTSMPWVSCSSRWSRDSSLSRRYAARDGHGPPDGRPPAPATLAAINADWDGTIRRLLAGSRGSFSAC